MSKLTLQLEELVVESFPTTDAEGGRGTVRGMDSATVDQDSCDTCDCSFMDTCPQPEITCFQSCAGSCNTCPVSCDPAQCPSSDGRC
jgi:hypothetical protein